MGIQKKGRVVSLHGSWKEDSDVFDELVSVVRQTARERFHSGPINWSDLIGRQGPVLGMCDDPIDEAALRAFLQYGAERGEFVELDSTSKSGLLMYDLRLERLSPPVSWRIESEVAGKKPVLQRIAYMKRCCVIFVLTFGNAYRKSDLDHRIGLGEDFKNKRVLTSVVRRMKEEGWIRAKWEDWEPREEILHWTDRVPTNFHTVLARIIGLKRVGRMSVMDYRILTDDNWQETLAVHNSKRVTAYCRRRLAFELTYQQDSFSSRDLHPLLGQPGGFETTKAIRRFIERLRGEGWIYSNRAKNTRERRYRWTVKAKRVLQRPNRVPGGGYRVKWGD